MSQISFDFTTSFVAARDAPSPAADAGDSEVFAERLQDAASSQSTEASPTEGPAPAPAADASDAESADTAVEEDVAEAVESVDQAEPQDDSASDEPADPTVDELASAEDVAAVAIVAPVVIDEVEVPNEIDGAELPAAEALLGEGGGDESADSSTELLDADLLAATNRGEEETPGTVEGELEATTVEQAEPADADAGGDSPSELEGPFVEEAASAAADDGDLEVLADTDAVEQSPVASRSTAATTSEEDPLPSAESDRAIETVSSTGEQEADASGGEEDASQPEFTTDTALNSASAGVTAVDTGEVQASEEAAAENLDVAATNNTDNDVTPVTRDDNRTSQTLARIAAGRVDQQNANEESGPRVDAARFVSRVAGAFQAAQERGGEVRIRLSPPELGALQVKITVADGVLNASLETENAAARNTILDNLPALRERLAEQEIRIEKFDVDVREEGSGSGQDFSAEEQSERQARGEGRSRSQTGDAPGEVDVPTDSQPTVSADGQINLIA